MAVRGPAVRLVWQADGPCVFRFRKQQGTPQAWRPMKQLSRQCRVRFEEVRAVLCGPPEPGGRGRLTNARMTSLLPAVLDGAYSKEGDDGVARRHDITVGSLHRARAEALRRLAERDVRIGDNDRALSIADLVRHCVEPLEEWAADRQEAARRQRVARQQGVETQLSDEIWGEALRQLRAYRDSAVQDLAGHAMRRPGEAPDSETWATLGSWSGRSASGARSRVERYLAGRPVLKLSDLERAAGWCDDNSRDNGPAVLRRSVIRAYKEGASWEAIGAALGVSRTVVANAYRRYIPRRERHVRTPPIPSSGDGRHRRVQRQEPVRRLSGVRDTAGFDDWEKGWPGHVTQSLVKEWYHSRHSKEIAIRWGSRGLRPAHYEWCVDHQPNWSPDGFQRFAFTGTIDLEQLGLPPL